MKRAHWLTNVPEARFLRALRGESHPVRPAPIEPDATGEWMRQLSAQPFEVQAAVLWHHFLDHMTIPAIASNVPDHLVHAEAWVRLDGDRLLALYAAERQQVSA